MRRNSEKYFDTIEESIFPQDLNSRRVVLAGDALALMGDRDLLKYVGAFSNFDATTISSLSDYLANNLDPRARKLLGDVRDAKMFNIDAYNKKAAGLSGMSFNLADKNVQRLSTLTALSSAYAANQFDLMIRSAWDDGLSDSDNRHRDSSETGSNDRFTATLAVVPFTYIGSTNAQSMIDHLVAMIDAAASRFTSEGRNSLHRDLAFVYKPNGMNTTVCYQFGNLPHCIVIELLGFDLNAISSTNYPYNNSASDMIKRINKPGGFGVSLLTWFAQTGFNPAPYLNNISIIDEAITGLRQTAEQAEYVVDNLDINKYLSTIYKVDVTSYTSVYTRTVANLKSSYSSAILDSQGMIVRDLSEMLQQGDIIGADRFLMTFVNTIAPKDAKLSLDDFYMNTSISQASMIHTPYYACSAATLGGGESAADGGVKSTEGELSSGPAGIYIAPKNSNDLAVQFYSLSRAERLLVFRCAELGLPNTLGGKLNLIEIVKVGDIAIPKVIPTERLLAAGKTRGELSRSLYVGRNVINDVIKSTGVYSL